MTLAMFQNHKDPSICVMQQCEMYFTPNRVELRKCPIHQEPLDTLEYRRVVSPSIYIYHFNYSFVDALKRPLCIGIFHPLSRLVR